MISSISIIIINYNTCDLLRSCLSSMGNLVENIDLWVVDNSSSDGSVEMLKNSFPAVNLIKNLDNVGFVKANNQALEKVQGEFVILLNPDTVVHAGWLEALISAFSDPGIGAACPQLLNEDGSIQPSWGNFPSVWSEFVFQSFLYKIIPYRMAWGKRIHPFLRREYTSTHIVDWGSGACLAIRREVIDRVGGLEDEIFMYGEDVEWCWRIRQAGYQILFVPQAKITHFSGKISKKDFTAWINQYTRSQLFLLQRLHGKKARWAGIFVVLGSAFRAFLWVWLALLPNKRWEARQRVIGYGKAIDIGWRFLLWGYH